LLSPRALLGSASSKALDIHMGRSFESVRLGVKDVSARWLKASRALKKDEQVYGQRLAEMAKKHSSEVFYGLDDPRGAGGILGAGGDAEGPICGRQEGQD